MSALFFDLVGHVPFFSYMPHICHGARAPVCADGQIMQLLLQVCEHDTSSNSRVPAFVLRTPLPFLARDFFHPRHEVLRRHKKTLRSTAAFLARKVRSGFNYFIPVSFATIDENSSATTAL